MARAREANGRGKRPPSSPEHAYTPQASVLSLFLVSMSQLPFAWTKMAANANANEMPNIAAHNEQARQIDDDDPNMVQWRGNLVPEKEAKALRHVFDNLQDHFGHHHQWPDPRVSSTTKALLIPAMVRSGMAIWTFPLPTTSTVTTAALNTLVWTSVLISHPNSNSCISTANRC